MGEGEGREVMCLQFYFGVPAVLLAHAKPYFGLLLHVNKATNFNLTELQMQAD